MIIGLISDSHGNIEYVKTIGRYFKDKAGVNLIVHLGDECDDADAINGLGIDIIKIPDVCSNYYHDPEIPNIIIKDIEGAKVLMTHSPQIPPECLSKDSKAVFYGHTHIARIEDKKGTLWVNPGHLREIDKRGNSASFAVVDINGGKLDARIIRYSDIT